MPDSAPSVLSSWTKTIVDALVASGADAGAVLETAGFDADALRDPNARLPLTATGRLWRAASEHMNDAAFGLRASRYVRPTTFHALGYAIFASSSLRDALQRLVRYSRVVSDAVALELESNETSVRLCFVLVSENAAPAPEAMDAVMSLIVRTCRTLTDRSFTLLKVEQRRPQPLDTTPYARFFRCPVAFDMPLDALTIDQAVLDQPLPAANPELAQHNDGLIRKYLSEIEQDSLVARVRAALVEQLGADLSPVKLAAALGMSVRTLQRRLQEQGTSIVDLLSEVRKELALVYLSDKTHSVTEIAFLLGFEDSSAFARAFRRWTGQSPSAYRADAR